MMLIMIIDCENVALLSMLLLFDLIVIRKKIYIDFMGDYLAEIERRDQLETQEDQERVDCDASGKEFQSPHRCC